MPNNNLNKSDRTRIRIQNAFLELLSEKSYFDITIDNIAKRADTYRSTFYRYYSSKEELLRDLEGKYLDQLHNKLPEFSISNLDKNNESFQKVRQASIDFLNYLNKTKSLSIFLFSNQSDSSFNNKIKRFIHDCLSTAFDNSSLNEVLDKELFITLYSKGLLAVLSEWLIKDDHDTETIADFFLDISCIFTK